MSVGVIARQGFKASISNYIGMGLGFLSLFILFPKFFEPEKLGAIRLFIELGTVLSALGLMGTHYSINRFFPYFKTQDHKHHGFFFWALVFPLIGYSILTLVLLLAGKPIFLFLNANALAYKDLFPYLLALVFIILYQVVSEVTCANHARIAVPNFNREVLLRGLLIVCGAMYYFSWVSFSQCVALMVVAYSIALASNIWFLRQLTPIHLKPDFKFLKANPNIQKEALSFTALLFFSGISSLLYTKMDFFMISALKQDLSQVAIYSIGFYLATFIEVPKRTILQIATPIISGHMKEENYAAVRDLNKKNGNNQLLISGMLFFLIWLNIDNLYAIMPRGEFYVQGKWVVFFIGISKLIDAVVSGNSPILVNSKFYGLSVISILVALISSFAYNYYFISHYGIIGAAISTILVMLSVNLCNVIVVHVKLNISPFHIDQIKILLLLSLFFCVPMLGNWVINPYLDSLLKTGIVGPIMVFSIYKLKISETFNQLLQSKIKWLN